MSRHIITQHNGDYEVVVGWDGPLETYFCQVKKYNPDPDNLDDELLLWEGNMSRQITSVAKLASYIAPYVALSDERARQLIRDRFDVL